MLPRGTSWTYDNILLSSVHRPLDPNQTLILKLLQFRLLIGLFLLKSKNNQKKKKKHVTIQKFTISICEWWVILFITKIYIKKYHNRVTQFNIVIVPVQYIFVKSLNIMILLMNFLRAKAVDMIHLIFLYIYKVKVHIYI